MAAGWCAINGTHCRGRLSPASKSYTANFGEAAKLILTFVERTKVERWLHKIFLSLALVFCLLRFAHLRADFPNHSPWMMEQAKFSAEGWGPNAAGRDFLIGHWGVAGDSSPAGRFQVWPSLLPMVFHFAGVSIVSARAVNVCFS